jgi:hypothetical protein
MSWREGDRAFFVPKRWGYWISKNQEALPQHRREVISAIYQENIHEQHKVPLHATHEEMENIVDGVVKECYDYFNRHMEDLRLVADGIAMLAVRLGILPPQGISERGTIARACNRHWWLRRIRAEHKRRVEHAAIRLGFTGLKTDPYISRESAATQAAINRHNEIMLESTSLQNEDNAVYTLAELSSLGTSNKAIRRGELMTRIRGCEEIAKDLKHIGMFWTITCPSKFHSVGGTNEKYAGATPRQAQAYLCRVWARTRAALARDGIRPYGFRIAEPHTDGCPHWHLLVFVEADHEARMEEVIKKYALAEDGEECGAKDNRVKLVRIEAGRGTASGYIAKYVSKNIDGAGVGDHKVFEDGTTYTITTDLFGEQELTASARVTYWSQLWSIRQFQAIGCAPVGVWRELRRIEEAQIRQAPEEVKRAWRACQKIDVEDPAVNKRADFAEYMRCQGGPNCGRAVQVMLANRVDRIEGRYETYDAPRPVGVFWRRTGRGAVWESNRHVWRVVGRESEEFRAVRELLGQLGQSASAVAAKKSSAPDPWTCVNNCTGKEGGGGLAQLAQKLAHCSKRIVKEADAAKIKIPIWIDWPEIRKEHRRISLFTG